MKLSKKIYYEACSLLPTRILSKLVSPSTLLPYHHLVSDKEVLHIKHLYPYKNVRQFKQDLDLLLKYYRPAAVEEINDALVRGIPLPKNTFLLSFDDGFREVHEIIAPVLSAKGVPAIFFINPAFIDNRILFYRCKISLIIEKLIQNQHKPALLQECESVLGSVRYSDLTNLISEIKKINNTNQHILDVLGNKLEISFENYLEEQRPFLTLAQLKSLQTSGFSIGAHSLDHPYYMLISPQERILQTVRSCEYLRQNLQPAPVLFSFPHSDEGLPQSFFNQLKITSPHIDLLFGIQNQKIEFNNGVLHRFNAEKPDLPMAKQLNGLLFLMLFQQLTGRKQVTRH